MGDAKNGLTFMADGYGKEDWRGILSTHGKTINCIECDPPFPLPEELVLDGRFKELPLFKSDGLKFFDIRPIGNEPSPVYKWIQFNRYLTEHAKVAVVCLEEWELFIPPPCVPAYEGSPLRVYYKPKLNSRIQRPQVSETSLHSQCDHPRPLSMAPSASFGYWAGKSESSQNPGSLEGMSRARGGAQVHPSHLETLEQMHAAWIFGAVAELIDNARDAKATRLDISIEEVTIEGNRTMPILQVVDNGLGMTHEEIVRMLSFGHKRPAETDVEQIGHFGVGFKKPIDIFTITDWRIRLCKCVQTGAMRLGSDSLILTQSKETCSMGFLSKSHNADLDVLEVPIVTYKKFADGRLKLDESVCTKQEEENCKKAVTKHSPFKNDMSIGAQFAKLDKNNGTCTCIFIYNLEQWEGQCIFNYSVKPKNDIQIRSKRVRARAGQISKQVPMDYSLREYVEVLFLVPTMKIYLQGTPVNTRSLTNKMENLKRFEYPFVDEKDPKKRKNIQLTLGKRQVEYNRGNCGIFLYWHGRLIEAYRRVGAMVHSVDIGRGIIGVIDVTDVMDFGNGKVGVLNNKQGFTDSDRFSKLEKWLDETFDRYWDENFDQYGVMKSEDLRKGEQLHLDDQWVQCNKCMKWRILPKDWNADDVLGDWFCFMKPFNGNCMMPEVKPAEDIFTVALNRDGIQKVAPVLVVTGSDSSHIANPAVQEGDDFTSSSSDDVGPVRQLNRIKRTKETVVGVKPKGTDAMPKRLKK